MMCWGHLKYIFKKVAVDVPTTSHVYYKEVETPSLVADDHFEHLGLHTKKPLRAIV